VPYGTIEKNNYSHLPNEMFGLGMVWAHFFKIPITQANASVGYEGVVG
jgi:hypothetical protein